MKTIEDDVRELGLLKTKEEDAFFKEIAKLSFSHKVKRFGKQFF